MGEQVIVTLINEATCSILDGLNEPTATLMTTISSVRFGEFYVDLDDSF